MAIRRQSNLYPFQKRAILHVLAGVNTMKCDGWRVLLTYASNDMYLVKMRHPRTGSNYTVRAYYKPIVGQPRDVPIYHVHDGVTVKTEILRDNTPRHYDTALH